MPASGRLKPPHLPVAMSHRKLADDITKFGNAVSPPTWELRSRRHLRGGWCCLVLKCGELVVGLVLAGWCGSKWLVLLGKG